MMPLHFLTLSVVILVIAMFWVARGVLFRLKALERAIFLGKNPMFVEKDRERMVRAIELLTKAPVEADKATDYELFQQLVFIAYCRGSGLDPKRSQWK